MSVTETLPAPAVLPPFAADERWRQERAAFQRLLPKLLEDSVGQFVAIHNGQVVARGADKIEVAQQAYSQCGYVPIYVGLVTTSPPPVVRIPTPRAAARL